MTAMGFECVVRALRIGKSMARDSDPGRVISYDYDNKLIIQCVNGTTQPYYACTEDILATDWFVWIPK